MQASFGQVLNELPADELLVLTDDVFCSFTTPTTVGYEVVDAGDQQPALFRS